MTLSELKTSLKRRYRNGPDNIGKDFVAPCLANSVLYRRGTGFFSSSALASYAEALDILIKDELRVQIICSPVIHDDRLKKILEQNITEEQKRNTLKKLTSTIVLDAIGYKLDEHRTDYRSKLLAYFIAKKIFEIKIAIPKNFNCNEVNEPEEIKRNLYHVKTGYFRLVDGEIIAFDGSFNETGSGHTFNIETTQVLTSWEEKDKDRIKDIVEDVDRDWNKENPYIDVLEIDKETLKIIENLAPKKRPCQNKSANNQEKSNLREYQKEALNNWQNNEYKGILEMATGTGKTRTAIHAIKKFQQNVNGGIIIITVPYQPLANQWASELDKEGLSYIKVYETVENWRSEVQNIADAHNNTEAKEQTFPIWICVNKTFKSDSFQSILKSLSRSKKHQMLIVDECHHFNNQKGMQYLPKHIQFRLGLSATPYESEEPKYMEKYFGDIVFQYTLSEAIRNGFLTRYEYHPVLIEFTNTEAKNYIETLRAIENNKLKNKHNIVNEDELDRILESLVNKLAKLREIVQNTGVQKKTLFYCGQGYVELQSGERIRQLHSVSRMLADLNWRISKITAEESHNDRKLIMDNFLAEHTDAIASIRILDEGIDIPDCRNAYILASQRTERQAIQRRGRVLRLADGKEKAILYDFIITGPKLSSMELQKLYDRELKRAKLFSKDAINCKECEDILNRI
uniref:DEAD/DEAH box helicase family protein n=1 Tax=Flavobacterium sp. TaxID=239 RepID=UPI0040473FBE